jgi:hypothetical protein
MLLELKKGVVPNRFRRTDGQRSMPVKQPKLLVVDNRPELKFAVEFAQEEAWNYELHMATSLEEACQKLKSNEYFGVLTTLLSPTQELPHLVVVVLRSGCRRIVIAAPHEEERAGTDKKMWNECQKELIRQRLGQVAREKAKIERVDAMQDGTCYWSPREKRLYKTKYTRLEEDADGFGICADVPIIEGEVLPDDATKLTAWYGVMMQSCIFPGVPRFGDYEMREAARAQY